MNSQLSENEQPLFTPEKTISCDLCSEKFVFEQYLQQWCIAQTQRALLLKVIMFFILEQVFF